VSPSRAVPSSVVVATFDSSSGVFGSFDVQSVDSCTVLTGKRVVLLNLHFFVGSLVAFVCMIV
jgi:hypothetical protein